MVLLLTSIPLGFPRLYSILKMHQKNSASNILNMNRRTNEILEYRIKEKLVEMKVLQDRWHQ